MKVRGYVGYYNGVYLRSSLEFAYAYYLDYKKKRWTYEKETLFLNGFSYKPDFYEYDNDGNLIQITEIKGETNKEDGLKRAEVFKEVYGVPIRVLSYKDIVKLYQEEMPISYHRAKRMWIEDYGAELNNVDMHGEHNPMYGVRHREETKKLISEKAKQRTRDPKFKEQITNRMIEYNRKTGFAGAKKPRSERITKYCIQCGSPYEVTKNSKRSEKRKFCSLQCASEYNSKLGAKVVKEKAKQSYESIKAHIEEWALQHSELILNTPLNKIKTTLQPLLDEIEEKYQVKDMRIISKAVFGEDKGRKELLLYLKQLVDENVRRTTGNRNL